MLRRERSNFLTFYRVIIMISCALLPIAAAHDNDLRQLYKYISHTDLDPKTFNDEWTNCQNLLSQSYGIAFFLSVTQINAPLTFK